MQTTAALAALILAFTGTAPLYPPSHATGAQDATLELYVLAELQSLRVQHRQQAWHADGRLAEAARSHSEDMARRRYFAHSSPEGRRVGDRAYAAGYTYQSVAENLFWTVPARREQPALAAQTVKAWLNSPAHREILFDDSLADVGVGVSTVGGQVHVTLVAGRRMIDS